MAPTSSPIITHSPSHLFGRYLHQLPHEGLNFPRHPPRRPTPSRTEMFMARTLDATSQPSVVFESPPPPPIAPTSPGLVVLAPKPSVVPVSNRPQELNQFADIPGNIAAAVVVIVLILGGLIGLIVGGETLRRQVKSTERRVSPPPSRCFGRRKPKPAKKTTASPQSTTGRETFPYDEKTLTPLMRPPPALHRERRRGLSDILPIRSLSWAMYDRRSCPEVEPSPPHAPPMASPQTTWSEFSPVSLYVAPARAVLASIPEEREDCQIQANSDFATMLGVTLRESLESGSGRSTAQTKNPTSFDNRLPESLVAARGRSLPDCRNVCKGGETEEDTKSLESSAPDMTMDEGESSRSSMASLESLEDGHDRDSLREEVFEVRRAHTRSMQMNKGVLLSLSMKTLDESLEDAGGPSHSPSIAGYVERELSLTMLGGNLSAVDLDEFPSPPSMLPMIPSLVSGF